MKVQPSNLVDPRRQHEAIRKVVGAEINGSASTADR